MDNNDFEQQFAQNVKASVTQPAVQSPTAYEPSTTHTASTITNKLPLIIAIALAAVTLVESIALIITLSNYFSIVNGDYEEGIDTVDSEDYLDDNFVYDDSYNLVAVNLNCTTEGGAKLTLTADSKYQLLSAPNSLNEFGTYTITNDSLISLNNTDGTSKVLYYDGFNIADGLTIYSCEEPTSESTTE